MRTGSCVTNVLATIRFVESGDNYAARGPFGYATGAYQMLEPSWKAWAKGAGVDTAPYPTAADAPPALQDAAARWRVEQILGTDPVDHVPLLWYIGYVPSPTSDAMDTVPAPDAGNTITPRAYQTKWLAELGRRGGCPAASSGPPSGTGRFPGDLNVPEPEFSSYPNGEFPEDQLVMVQSQCRRIGCRLSPRAAAAFLAMADAADRDGVTLTITSAYRSRADQERILREVGAIEDGGLGAAVGQSPHGLAIATDINSIPAGVYPWLVANADRFCFANALQDSLKGKEPWHWAWTGAATGCVSASA